MKKMLLMISAVMYLLSVTGVAWAEDMVGVIMSSADVPYYVAIQKGIEDELAKQGAAAKMVVQKPAPSEMAWKNSARKLVTLEAKVIVAYGGGTAVSAASEAPDLPVVYCGVFDPASVTGKNVTGVEAKVPLQALVNLLKKVSNFTKLGILFSSDEPDSVKQADAVAALGGDVVKTDVKGQDSIALPDGVQAVFLTCSGAVQNQKALAGIVEKARAGKIATASVFGGSAELGVLISMSANAEQQSQEAAKMIAGILKGGAASSFPVASGSKVELTVNLVEAKAMGINIPFEILGTAKVIK